MDDGALYMAALLVGVFGAGHCVGMCGSITTALTLSFPPETRKSPGQRLQHLLAINIGRIFGYGFIGSISGLIGAGALSSMPASPALWVSRLISIGFLLALGLYYLGFDRLLSPLEKQGHFLWKRLQPLTLKLQPGKTLPVSFGCGFVWSFLPCGMVYSSAALAFASANAITGTQVMLLFGLATMPTLLSAGFFAAELDKLLQHPWSRKAAALGLFVLAAALALQLHL